MMLPKPSRSERKEEERKVRARKISAERNNKVKVRRRDRGCRFPLCGCRKKNFRSAVSHDVHKGMGSKDGVSTTELMVELCEHRHQFGRVSRHAGTLRTVHLTDAGYNGPVAWFVDLGVINRWSASKNWFEVAREDAPGRLQPLTATQKAVLEELAKMTDF